MRPERWREIRALFDRVQELPPDERARVLDAACAEDPELRHEVESLHDLAAEAEPFLESPAAEDAALFRATETGGLLGDFAPTEDESAARPGGRIGPYRIVREIGHGGMGTVYLAERSTGDFGQRVALKVIRRGMDTELVVERFLAERRILAALEHPNIARLLDGGTTGDGLPYFVMEYIEGEALLDYCDARRLSVAARLALFGEVCRAVQYAHQRLVVHRDLKPTNILVTAEGVPKLLDFGLSRVLHPDGTSETLGLTALGLRMMTPEYASPEQARGELVTTASDVYSLGILLFELLTGRRPYRIKSRRAADLERAICDEIPERPSTAAAKSGEVDTPAGTVTLTAEEASGVREGSVARLRRALAGDIDNIVLKALKKEPDRRYASAGELAEDIRRHLAGRPVTARPDTVGYRAAKFVRRHAVALATAGSVLALFAVLVGLYTAQLARARDRAEVKSAQANELASFLASLFELSDLDRTKGEKLSARDILDRGAARIEGELASQPEVAGTMMNLIGNVYRQLDLFAQARPLLERALAERRSAHGEASLEVAAFERDLAMLLHRTGDEKTAEELLRQALGTQQGVLGPGSVEVARTRVILASVRRRLGDYAGATSEFTQALAILDVAPPPDEAALAKTLGEYGLHLATSGEGAKSLPYLSRTIEIDDRLFGRQSPSAGENRLHLGIALRETGAMDEAIRVNLEALVIVEKALGRNHSFYPRILVELGSDWTAKEEVAKAKAAYLEAITDYDRILGPEHEYSLGARRNLAILLVTHGDPAGALPLFAAVLAAREKSFGPNHPEVADGLFDVAKTRKAMGDFGGVEALMRRGLAVYRATLPGDNIDLAGALDDFGEFLCAHGSPGEGRKMIEESAAIFSRSASPYAPDPADLARAIERCGSAKT